MSTEARQARGPVVELGVGTGRIAVPVAAAGVRVIGVDSSPGMLDVCRERAEDAGVAERLDLRLGDLRDPPVSERVRLVTCPFRSYLHLADDAERLEALRRRASCSSRTGGSSSTSSRPSREDIEETNGRWLEREPGIWERADWDEDERPLVLGVRSTQGETTMMLSWLAVSEWRELLERAGSRSRPATAGSTGAPTRAARIPSGSRDEFDIGLRT